MGRLSLRNPLATPEQIAESPSQRQGMSADVEASMRSYTCHLIQASGTILCLPQLVMATAQVLLQRFYYLASIQDFPLRGIVLGTLFLACKAEENPQTIRNIINVVDIVVKRDRRYPEVVTDGYDPEYYELKNEMVIGEMQVLRRLAFNVQVELPYRLLANYLRSLKLTDQERVPQLAWNYMNNLLRTPVYVCFQPETIACGAIFFGSARVQYWTAYQPAMVGARKLKMHGEGVLDEHVAQMRKEMRDKLDAELAFASQEKNVDEGDGGGKRSQAEHVDDGTRPKSRRGVPDSTSRDHNRRRHTSSRSRDTRHSSYRPH
ncbi:hypothetical protein LPJ76_006361 [Coemansia sp. RSA 638]|nr:hypothetical protein LPJ76_006361 [Coemansia sp. RSA 638]